MRYLMFVLFGAVCAYAGNVYGQEYTCGVEECVILKGPIEPEAALAYMTHTDRLNIIDVRGKAAKRFTGATILPIMDLSPEELYQAIMAIPATRPVLINCNQGIGAKKLYDKIQEIRPSLPDVLYIDGVPLFDEYEKAIKAK